MSEPTKIQSIHEFGVVGETPIYTGYGLIPIEELWQNESCKRLPLTRVQSSVSKEREMITYANKVIRREYIGNIIEITLSSGLTLRCTPEQRIRLGTIKPRWKAAGELRAGDELKRVNHQFAPAITQEISDRLGYTLGFIYGDGHVDGNRIQINQSSKNMDLVDNLMSISPFPFIKYVGKPQERQLGKYAVIETKCALFTSNHALAETYTALMRPTINSILMLPDKTLAAFFAGILDSDGDLNFSKGRLIAIRIYPTNDMFDVTVLLHALKRFGITARIRDRLTLKLMEITGDDCTRLVEILRPYSIKIKRKEIPEKIKTGMPTRRTEKIVAIRRLQYSGYAYNLQLGCNFNNYAAAFVYIHK